MLRVANPASRMLLLAGCVLAVGGCALFTDGVETAAQGLALRPVVESRDGIHLEAYFIDRPVGDPLIGEALWREIDQISSIAPDVRFRLNEAGIRYGVSGSDLPKTLSALLSDRETGSAAQQTRRLDVPLVSGSQGELEVSVLPRRCRIRMPGRTAQDVREYDDVRCVLRVTAQRMQEGWVRLEFLPEIHHGVARARYAATERDWQMQQSQNIEPLYEQRFSVALNIGEYIVIGAAGGAEDSVGQHLFRGGEPDPQQERLILLRVRDMQRIDPVPVENWAALLP